MDKRTKEIRTLLSGFTAYELDGAVLIAAQGLADVENPDIYPGADAAFFLGVHCVMRQYTVQGNVKAAHEACIRAFADLGRRAVLRAAPDALVMLCKPLTGKPCVVTLEASGKQLLLCIYTARTPLCALRTKKLLKRLSEALPKTLTETKISMVPYDAFDAERQAAQVARKEAVAAKKAEKAVQKAARKAAAGKQKQSADKAKAIDAESGTSGSVQQTANSDGKTE